MPEQCPVSGQLVDEGAVRLTAFCVLLVMLAFTITVWWPLAAFLAADFLVRALGKGKYSPLYICSRTLLRWSKSPPTMIDAAPKRFAAGIGLALSLLAMLLCLGGFATAARVVAAVIMACAALEAFARLCLGCKVYSLIANIK